MPSITSTIWPIDPHTQAKHEILKNYLQAWFPILGTTSGRVIYLDGFAGPGIYRDGEEGSPLIAIRTAKNHVLRPRFRAEIIFWFIEKEPDRARKLEEVLRDYFPTLPNNMEYKVEGAEFAPKLGSVLDEMEEKNARLAPTFAFLDPFGFSGLPMRLVERLLSYKKCEVLITFMSGFVNRFSDEFREEVLDELYGCPQWRTIREIEEPDKRIEFLIKLYTDQLQRVGGAEYIRTFEMIGNHNQTLYHLVYGTKHWKGLEAMKEAMFRVDTRGTYRFSDVTDVNQKFIIDYANGPYWVSEAGDLIFKKLRGQRVSIDDIHKFVVTETPYIFRKAILKHLEENEPSKIINVDGRQRRFTYPHGCSITFRR